MAIPLNLPVGGRPVVPVEGRKVEMSCVTDITRMLLTDQFYPDNTSSQIESIAMNSAPAAAYIAFEANRGIAAGDLRAVARAAKELLDRRKDASILIFDGVTGHLV